MNEFERSILEGMLKKEQLKITLQQAEVFAEELYKDINTTAHHATIHARKLYFILIRTDYKGKHIDTFKNKMRRVFFDG